MKNKEFDFYSQYKKKWILPLVFVTVLIVCIVGCILFNKYDIQIAYDISLSVFTGNLVFFLTQFILYLNKRPKIQMQEDRNNLSTVLYKFVSLKERINNIDTLKQEETYFELKNILKESYKILLNHKKTLKRTSKILAKRIDYSLWAYFFYFSSELDKINHSEFLNNSETYIKVGVLSLKYSQIKDSFNEKIERVHAQMADLYEEYDLFYQNEKQKIVDDLF